MFKNLRKFYKNNRIYCILMIISITCILFLGTSVIVYFINQNNSDPYGNRLVDIDEHDLGDGLTKLQDFYKGQTGVLEASCRLQGKIIYADIKVEDAMSLDSIQNIATSSLDIFTEDELNYYDIQFMVTRDSYPAYSGSKSSANKTITWANYNIDSEEETTTTTTKK